jgi:DUF4097 and DUF4098 domain-containing protein YvlB
MQRFDLPVAVILRLHARSGDIDVIGEPRDDVAVEGDHFHAEPSADGTSLEIRAGRAGSKSLKVRCPAGTDVVVGTQSGTVRLAGDLGVVSVTTASGGIEVDHADEADLRTAAGSIKLRTCGGRCRMNSLSGSVTAGDVGAASAGTVSGSISLGHVAGSMRVRSVSGSIEAACEGEGTIEVKTVSGKVRITMPEGTGVSSRFKTMAGKVRNPFPPGSDCRVDAMSVSGTIELVPA